MKKTIVPIIMLIASIPTTVTAANNVYVKLACENNITVDITLMTQEEVGWANLTTPSGTQRAMFLWGRGNAQGGDDLAFASRGIAFHVAYTADKKFTLKMISGGSGEYSCKVI